MNKQEFLYQLSELLESADASFSISYKSDGIHVFLYVNGEQIELSDPYHKGEYCADDFLELVEK